MQSKLVWRIVIIIAVLVMAFFKLYPVDSIDGINSFKKFPPSINLGLDLKGGMHLIVQIDKSAIYKAAAADSTIKIKKKLQEATQKTLEILRNRIDQFGVAEPSIVKQGEDRIEIELPGLRNPKRAEKLIGTTAVLEFRMVHFENDKLVKSRTDENGDLLPGAIIPAGYELIYNYPKDKNGLPRLKADGKTRMKIPYFVKRKIELKGEDLRHSNVQFSQTNNKPIIAFQLKPKAAKIFADLTEKYRERNESESHRLAIILDNVIIMAPHIKSRIPGGSGIIEGGFSLNEAKDISITLNAGALPIPISIIEKETVGPTLGADSIKKGLLAAKLGLIAVIIFMAIQYLAAGIIADIALLLNLFLMLSALAAFGATLTLPGVAGIILTVGMAVDANVIVYERIKEELRLGKTFKSALDTGYSKALITILDANITTIIVAIVLYQFGAGPIRGFAVTLIIGILASMFTALYVTKTIFILLTNKTFKTVLINSPWSYLMKKN